MHVWCPNGCAPRSHQLAILSRLHEKTIVFTGSMNTGSRVELEKQAKSFGAKVAKSVSAKTDFLVTGEKVGVKKITDAENKGVKVIAEKEYLQMITSV